MKLTPHRITQPGHSQHGSAVLALLAFLTVMVILCAATTRAVYLSQREVALIEKQQLTRLVTTTNMPPAPAVSTSPK